MEDKLVKVRISGKLIMDVLENGVSLYPKYDGRFPCTSGFKFKFDPSKEAGSRILPNSVFLDSGEPIELHKTYTLSMKYFLLAGKDGYNSFLNPSIELLSDIEEAPTLPRVFLKHLSRLQMSKEDFEKMLPKDKNKTLLRLQKLNTNVDNRCEETGFIKIAPGI